MRRKWIFDKASGEMVEVSPDYQPPAKPVHVISDIAPFISPIDRTEISSRSALREHERRYEVRQCGNDWTGSEKPAWWDNINS